MTNQVPMPPTSAGLSGVSQHRFQASPFAAQGLDCCVATFVRGYDAKPILCGWPKDHPAHSIDALISGPGAARSPQGSSRPEQPERSELHAAGSMPGSDEGGEGEVPERRGGDDLARLLSFEQAKSLAEKISNVIEEHLKGDEGFVVPLWIMASLDQAVFDVLTQEPRNG